MSSLDYLTDTSHACTANDVNVVAFEEAAAIIGGCDIVEEFLACGM
jgi:hypothetical protein